MSFKSALVLINLFCTVFMFSYSRHVTLKDKYTFIEFICSTTMFWSKNQYENVHIFDMVISKKMSIVFLEPKNETVKRQIPSLKDGISVEDPNINSA